VKTEYYSVTTGDKVCLDWLSLHYNSGTKVGTTYTTDGVVVACHVICALTVVSYSVGQLVVLRQVVCNLHCINSCEQIIICVTRVYNLTQVSGDEFITNLGGSWTTV